MSLIKWEPFREFDSFFDDFLPMKVNSQFGISTDLAVNVYEEGDQYIAEMHVPGMKSEQIHVEVKENHVVISGSREEKHEEKKRNYYRKEIRSGSFERVVPLPGPVKKSDVNAEYKNGVLKVIMPKQAHGEDAVKVQVKE